MHKLHEHLFWQNLLKFYDKMDLSIRMKIINNVRHRYAIRLEFGDKFLTFLTTLVLEREASVCSTVKLSHCRKFSVFVVVVIT